MAQDPNKKQDQIRKHRKGSGNASTRRHHSHASHNSRRHQNSYPVHFNVIRGADSWLHPREIWRTEGQTAKSR